MSEPIFDPGLADLEERQALGRVEGIRTDLEDITEVEYRQVRLERVVLVGIVREDTSDDPLRTFDELRALAETAGSHVVGTLQQRRDHPDVATFLGSGKVSELAQLVADCEADTIICDDELTAAQLRNMEDRTHVKVVDRTALILDIFAQHAKSKEGKAQVELAQLTYLRQRLRGWGDSLSRQVGGRASSGVGIGGRGPGETKIETDRRRIATRIAQLRRRIKAMKADRDVTRAARVRNSVPSVAIVGYTNAGKSSLLNLLTGAGVLVDDSLFATLDPTTRRTTTAGGRLYTLTDTVGFIRRLPTDLVDAFASTLEEAKNADVLLHVVDASDPDPEGQVRAVRQVLADIGADQIPEVIVLNKIDVLGQEDLASVRTRFPDAQCVSIAHEQGIEALTTRIEDALGSLSSPMRVLIPFDRGDLIDKAHRLGVIDQVEHTGDGTAMTVRANPALAGILAGFVVSDQDPHH